ncbi:MAG: glycosyltransferase family 2 protein [Elusimicrobia bacterium]|nr:glycosyltransferase family 2 protein [Elusimicrobiota bacterium]
MTVHILLPAYNEEAALPPLFAELSQVLEKGSYRIWVVDDGSRDRTAAVTEEWRDRVPITLLRHERNAGLGRALQTGMFHILSVLEPPDTLVTLDADHTHPPQLIPLLLKPLAEGEADFSIASRFVSGGRMVGVPILRRVASFGARWLMSALFHIPNVRDYTCGFRACKGELLRRGQERWGELVTENGFASSLEWLLKLSMLEPRIVEIPLVLRYDLKPTASKMKVIQAVQQTLALAGRFWRIKHI